MSLIDLNVGGVKYTTSKTTLSKYEDSMLYRMICTQLENKKDAEQRIFIDRDGQLFRYILNFLRDG